MKDVEKRIQAVEGFKVRVLHSRDGRDVRSDKKNVKQYPYKRALRNSKTVKAWRDGRFAKSYPGYTVVVLDGDTGHEAHGRTLLSNVRDSYLADE